MGSDGESWSSRLSRWGFNWFPAYRGTGGRIVFIRGDWSEVHIELRLSWRTRNYVGTTFGGSLYGAVDPIYMVMLIKLLGSGYVVWDKSATIRFRRPGRDTLHATFVVEAPALAGIREELTLVPKVERSFSIDLVDRAGVVHATVEKTLQIRRREVGSAAGDRSPEPGE